MSLSSSGVGYDPNAWAEKQRAAKARAQAIRDARSEKLVDDDHTFQPALNKRPSYLDKRPTDQIDLIAGNAGHADNIFEKPLPGKSTYSAEKKAQAKDRTHASDNLGYWMDYEYAIRKGIWEQ